MASKQSLVAGPPIAERPVILRQRDLKSKLVSMKRKRKTRRPSGNSDELRPRMCSRNKISMIWSAQHLYITRLQQCWIWLPIHRWLFRPTTRVLSIVTQFTKWCAICCLQLNEPLLYAYVVDTLFLVRCLYSGVFDFEITQFNYRGIFHQLFHIIFLDVIASVCKT